MTRILVLADGEIYGTLSGCKIYEVPDDWGPAEVENNLQNMFDGEDTAV